MTATKITFVDLLDDLDTLPDPRQEAGEVVLVPCAVGHLQIEGGWCEVCDANADRWFDTDLAPLVERIKFTQPGIDWDLLAGEMYISQYGPDSTKPDGPSQRWDWYSGGADNALVELAQTDPEPQVMLDHVTRLVHSCLVTNAVHEIGEFFKIGGSRVYPPHRTAWDDGPEGNGCVVTTLGYDGFAPDRGPTVAAATWNRGELDRFVRRLARLLPSDAIAYQPGKDLTWLPNGPLLTDRTAVCAYTGVRSDAVLQARWSAPVAEAFRSGVTDEVLVATVAADLHRAAVVHEVHEIGEFLTVDGDRVFNPHASRAIIRTGAPATGHDLCGPITVTLRYDG